MKIFQLILFFVFSSWIASGQVMDEDAFTNHAVAEIPETASLIIEQLASSPSLCGDSTGTIEVKVTGGTNPIGISLNNRMSQSSGFFETLSAGSYQLHIEDAAGCKLDTTLRISQTGCPIYIPNIFSPNGDGVNDLFQIQTGDQNEVIITKFFIFDRWGNNVYKAYDISIHSTDKWWDGTYKRFTLNQGVFAYYLEVEFKNGTRETYKGDVTLIR